MINNSAKLYYVSYSLFKNIFTIFVLVIIDLLSKAKLFDFLKHQSDNTYLLNKYCDLISVWNYGISFGMFTNYQQYSNIVFLIINSFIVIYLCYLLYLCKSYLSFFGFNLVIGGAVGNILDRLYHGAVFDFIYLHYNNYGFAVFNFADSFISVGVVLLILDYYANQKHIEEK